MPATPVPAGLMEFDLVPSSAVPEHWILRVADIPTESDPELQDEAEVYLLNRSDLRDLYGKLHSVLFPLKPEPENQFTVG